MERHGQPAANESGATPEPGTGGGSTSDDALIRLNDVPKIGWLPRRRRGSRLAVPTLHRWCTPGCRGVRLRHVRVGGVRCTTERWLREFFAELAGAAAGERPYHGAVLPHQRRRAPDPATVTSPVDRELSREGF